MPALRGVTIRRARAQANGMPLTPSSRFGPVPATRTLFGRRRRVLQDVAAGQLADVTFITPTARGVGSRRRDQRQRARLGRNRRQRDRRRIPITGTEHDMLVLWDDWGGWFDHVAPTIYNSYEDGFRVPLLVISPYAKRGHVSHTVYEFGSILKFIETTFTLPSLDTTDARANNVTDPFDFGSHPRKFVPIPRRRSKQYFLSHTDDRNPDDDY